MHSPTRSFPRRRPRSLDRLTRVLTGLLLLAVGGEFGTRLFAEALAVPPLTLRSVAEWVFDREGDLQGWKPNAQLAAVRVEAGALRSHAEGPDPMLELEPRLDLTASPWQAIEIRLHADADGTAEFFWSGTDQGRYGGFSQEKSVRFPVLGDRIWRTYRLLPGWQNEGRIRRLRFDVYDGAHFSIAAIRVVAWNPGPAVEKAEFAFPDQAAHWGRLETRVSKGPSPAEPDPTAWWLAPPVQLEADRFSVASIGWTVPAPAQPSDASPDGTASPADKPAYARLLFLTDREPGLKTLSFPVDLTPGTHFANLDLLASSGWQGTIRAVGLAWEDVLRDRARLERLGFTDQPQGPPRLKIVAFDVADALPRAGRPVTLRAIVANDGGGAASGLQAQLTLPSGVRSLDATEGGFPVQRLGYDEQTTLTWRIESPAPAVGTLGLEVRATNAPLGRAQREVRFTSAPQVPRTHTVPEPQPVRGPYEVGVYYFPGWKTPGQWHPIRPFPERRPVLGWYREGDPDVADWHIKWAVEHGITFFAYDWYWSQGARQLEHALHDGYFRARYRHLLKFCLLWANHNAPGTSSLADCRAVTRHWIAHYFHRPEHLRYENHPVVIIFSPDRLTADLGAEGVRPALEAMREECRQAGLPGLHIAACIGDATQARQVAQQGYDAVTAYTWPGLGLAAGELDGPFETLLEGYRQQWAQIRAAVKIPLHLPVCGGWDSRPWHGENNLIRWQRTPELFRRHLADARTALETAATNPPPLVIIEAWNEWGEGAYIEPQQEFGFGYLDALRQVFTDAPRDHLDLAPADVGMGPYDVSEPTVTQTVWDFGEAETGWEDVMDLTNVRRSGGVLEATSSGNDPAWFGPPLQVRASAYGSLVLRLQLRPRDGEPFTDRAQLFWRTTRLPESEGTSVRFEVHGDGNWHEYRIPLATNPRWRGVITRLRVDPCNRRNVEIALDRIALEP